MADKSQNNEAVVRELWNAHARTRTHYQHTEAKGNMEGNVTV